MVPPCSDRVSRAPPYSRTCGISTRTGLSPALADLSMSFRFLTTSHWPGPRSLATTSGVSVDVLSSGYLDVSVPRVRFNTLCIQMLIPSLTSGCWLSSFGLPAFGLLETKSTKPDNKQQPDVEGGFPHSEICGSKAVRASPQLFAAYHVLHRLSTPRHPPDALKTLVHFHSVIHARIGARTIHSSQIAPAEQTAEPITLPRLFGSTSLFTLS